MCKITRRQPLLILHHNKHHNSISHFNVIKFLNSSLFILNMSKSGSSLSKLHQSITLLNILFLTKSLFDLDGPKSCVDLVFLFLIPNSILLNISGASYSAFTNFLNNTILEIYRRCSNFVRPK